MLEFEHLMIREERIHFAWGTPIIFMEHPVLKFDGACRALDLYWPYHLQSSHICREIEGR